MLLRPWKTSTTTCIWENDLTQPGIPCGPEQLGLKTSSCSAIPDASQAVGSLELKLRLTPPGIEPGLPA